MTGLLVLTKCLVSAPKPGPISIIVSILSKEIDSIISVIMFSLTKKF